MESQNKASMDGVGIDVKVVETPRRVKYSDFLLRILGLALTLVAAVVLVAGKETRIVSVIITDAMPPWHLPVTAKWQDMSATAYFMVSNAIACSYAAVSLVLSMVARRDKNGMALVLIVFDLIMVGLLFSANGAAAAIGVIGLKGNSHVRWKKVCNVFDNYCDHLVASVILSLLGSLVFSCLVVLAALSLHKKSKLIELGSTTK